MNNLRYVYVVVVQKDGMQSSKLRWIKCAFPTRKHAVKWIKKAHEREFDLIKDSPLTEYRIKQVILRAYTDPRIQSPVI